MKICPKCGCGKWIQKFDPKTGTTVIICAKCGEEAK
jgi:uncharacterized protein (DUF983 family)